MIDCLNDKKHHAAAYGRLSKENLLKGNASESILNQKALIQEYANKNGIEIYDYYMDDGFTGSNFDRPEFKRMLRDIENGVIDIVITKDISRLGRDFIGTSDYIYNYFPEHKVRYISILENYDSLKPNGVEDILPYHTLLNHSYLKDTSKKIKSVRHEKMARGLYVGSSVPYGYKRSEEDNRKFVIDEYAANIVKRIFKMKYEGITNVMIARTLTNEGVLPPSVYSNKNIEVTYTTNLWKPSTIANILGNEVYIGTLTQGKYQRINTRSKRCFLLPKDQWIIVKNNHEPIIDEELFHHINSQKTHNEQIRMVKYDYLLKGLVVCADCGKTMLVRPCKGKPIYCCKTYARYRNNVCSMHYFREDKLNKIVLKEVRNVLKSFHQEKSLSEKYDNQKKKQTLIPNYELDLKQNKSRLKLIEKALSDLYIDRTSEIITIDEFQKLKNDLTKEKEKLILRISDLELMIGKGKIKLGSGNEKEKVISDFLKMKNPDKFVLNQLIKRIEIDEQKNVKIYFNFNINGVAYEKEKSIVC